MCRSCVRGTALSYAKRRLRDLEARIAARRHLEPKAVRIEEERRVVLRVVLRPELRRVQDLGTRSGRAVVDAVDFVSRLDGERDVVEAGRIEVELLIDERLAEAERARTGPREAQVLDLFAALARHEERRLEAERSEHGGVERDRRVEVAAHEVEMAEADEHQSTATG